METAWRGAAGAMVLFVLLRGFGWDGDSIISASQFHHLFSGIDDGGTHPKLGMILLLGLWYQLVPGGFYSLTFLSIALNACAIACMCVWVADLGGMWLLPVAGMCLNVMWLGIVVSCDNPAFSIPLMMMGLYLYFHRERRTAGLWLAFLAGLFRPGAELVLAFMIAESLWKRRRVGWLAPSLLALGLLHSLYGYRLVYSSEQQFIRLCIFYAPYSVDPRYLHSPRVLGPFLRSVESLLESMAVLPLVLLACAGLWRGFQSRLSLRWLLAGLSPSLLLLVGAAKFGTTHNIEPDKLMEFALLVPIFAGLCPLRLPSPVWVRKAAVVGLLWAMNYLTHHSQEKNK